MTGRLTKVIIKSPILFSRHQIWHRLSKTSLHSFQLISIFTFHTKPLALVRSLPLLFSTSTSSFSSHAYPPVPRRLEHHWEMRVISGSFLPLCNCNVQSVWPIFRPRSYSHYIKASYIGKWITPHNICRRGIIALMLPKHRSLWYNRLYLKTKRAAEDRYRPL